MALGLLLQAKAVLDTQRVEGTRTLEHAGQSSATITVSEARQRGVTTPAGVLALLPLVQLRSARGETGISLRGARREQVVVTLDDIPLNDPATGIADLADVPLVLLDRLEARPGAAPMTGGSGAIGGVLALSTAARPAIAGGGGAFGQRFVEGMWAARVRRSRLFLAGADRGSRNDFRFTNVATDDAVRERRINNDERRSTVAAGWMAPRHQLLLLGTRTERGMVGPMNVRAYDQDRATTERALMRWQSLLGSTVLRAGVRVFRLGYQDPAHPDRDARSRVVASDLDTRGSAAGGTWQVGGSHDALQGTGGVRQTRARAFAAWERPFSVTPHIRAEGGVRFDAVQGITGVPTGHLGLTWRPRDDAGSMWTVNARVARALRIPTLYDLFFHSPQRVAVRALRPELVTVDASVGVRAGHQSPGQPAWHTELALVHRRTRDAIVWFPGNFGWSPSNVGEESLAGLEGQAAVEGKPWRLSVWGSVYEPLLHTGGLRIPTPYVARVHGGFAGTWQPGRRWRATAQWRWQGARPYTAGPRNPAYELPSVSLLDLAVSRRVSIGGRAALVSVGLDNAANAEWQSVRGFPMPPRAWSLATSWPAP